MHQQTPKRLKQMDASERKKEVDELIFLDEAKRLVDKEEIVKVAKILVAQKEQVLSKSRFRKALRS